MSTYPFHFSRALARALNTVVVITFVALVIGLSSAAFGANPAEEMAKVGTTDPKGDSRRARKSGAILRDSIIKPNL